MDIRLISPTMINDDNRPVQETFKAKLLGLSEGRMTLDIVNLERGPSSVETEFEEAVAAPEVAKSAFNAQDQGFDAVVINCFADPGLEAAREVTTIPVLGPGESSMHLAAMLSHGFSVLTVLDTAIRQIHHKARLYGVADLLVSVRSVDVPVLELMGSEQLLRSRLVEQAQSAVEQDGAEAVVLGCTGMLDLASTVQTDLKHRGVLVPVIDPLLTALAMARLVVELGLSHSLTGYRLPCHKIEPIADYLRSR